MPELPDRKNILNMHGKKVHIVSLGCPKNLVDSEVMAGILAEGGYLLTDRPEEADILLINTCAFILPAREESIEEILRMAAWKQAGKRPLHPSGRHRLPPPALREGTGGGAAGGRSLSRHGGGSPHRPTSGRASCRLPKTGSRRRSVIGRPTFLMNAGHRRLISTPANSAYIKIADGCSNRCSYCVIPSIRGKARSRTIDDIVKEAEALAAGGSAN